MTRELLIKRLRIASDSLEQVAADLELQEEPPVEVEKVMEKVAVAAVLLMEVSGECERGVLFPAPR